MIDSPNPLYSDELVDHLRWEPPAPRGALTKRAILQDLHREQRLSLHWQRAFNLLYRDARKMIAEKDERLELLRSGQPELQVTVATLNADQADQAMADQAEFIQRLTEMLEETGATVRRLGERWLEPEPPLFDQVMSDLDELDNDDANVVEHSERTRSDPPSWPPTSPTVSIITAPFSPPQIYELHRWQTAGWVHPFTCGGEHDPQVVLMPVRKGWICPAGCGYTQDWAHAMMADGSLPAVSPLEAMRREASENEGTWDVGPGGE